MDDLDGVLDFFPVKRAAQHSVARGHTFPRFAQCVRVDTTAQRGGELNDVRVRLRLVERVKEHSQLERGELVDGLDVLSHARPCNDPMRRSSSSASRSASGKSDGVSAATLEALASATNVRSSATMASASRSSPPVR